MRDPFSWSFPLGRMAGITVRVHILFVVFVLAMWLRTFKDFATPGSSTAILILMGLVFVSVLLHEFGHCYAARFVGGDATDVLLWPLGGLARCDVPNTPAANLLTAVGGPAVNLLLCLLTASILLSCSLVPPFNPLPDNAFHTFMGNWANGNLHGGPFAPRLLPGDIVVHPVEYWQFLVAQLFWVNWFMLLLNLLPAFPLDGGRMLQAILWPRTGYRQAMQVAIFIGFLVMLIVGIYSLYQNELLWFCLALFIWSSCKQEYLILETGGEESLFGYDFSQGYTSLEQDQPPRPRRKRQNFFQRWLQRRNQRKMQRDMEQAVQEERRMDELLAKIQLTGYNSLTEEEKRFMKRVSDKYRNRP
jgi:Zn-dependent protease